MKLEPVWISNAKLAELKDKRVASVGAGLNKEKPSEEYTAFYAIPEGYKLVPVEPTEAMIEAGGEVDATPDKILRMIYKAMIEGEQSGSLIIANGKVTECKDGSSASITLSSDAIPFTVIEVEQ